MLDIADVDPLFQEEGGEGVAEHVGGDVAGEAGGPGVLAEHGADGLLGEAVVAETVAEEGSVGQEVVAPGVLVEAEGQERLFVAEEEPRSPSLPQDTDLLAAQVHVRDREVADFRDPGSGAEHGDHPRLPGRRPLMSMAWSLTF